MTTTQKRQRTPDITADVGGQKNVDQLHKTSRDFRSDTFTMPTDAQLQRSMTASRGDDVYLEDTDTAALEARIARMCGKEACMFGASGTMTNQLAIRTHLKQPPHSVITDHRAHVHMFEAGGIALFSQATTHGIVAENGIHLTAEDVRGALQLGTNIHIAPTKLICLENTLSGIVFPQEEIVEISKLAHENDIAMHLDGARLWNVAAKEIEERGLDASNQDDVTTVMTDLLEPFDSASLCLSKGIGAPVGSAIVGSKDFIDRCKWFRKAFGGGWRQVGGLAAMADHGLTHHFPRLAETHALARRLADGLKAAGFEISAPVDTNMVFWDATPLGLKIKDVIDALAAHPDPITIGSNRCVLHHQTSPQAVDDFIDVVTRLADGVPVDKRSLREAGTARKGIQVLTPPSDPVQELHHKESSRKRVKLGY
ncbi:hypothetical protein CspHIS471_0503120 [Cutaneotrichosporon sp. HIS471]|nr:hypothetical protein CspHIS471_0503120 [Cutaneotrichosporon sp. HIS471]